MPFFENTEILRRDVQVLDHILTMEIKTHFILNLPRPKITTVNACPTTLLKKGVLNQHTFYVQKTTHLKVCYSSTPLGVLFACPENNTPLGVF
jgi:hypothetical protein